MPPAPRRKRSFACLERLERGCLHGHHDYSSRTCYSEPRDLNFDQRCRAAWQVGAPGRTMNLCLKLSHHWHKLPWLSAKFLPLCQIYTTSLSKPMSGHVMLCKGPIVHSYSFALLMALPAGMLLLPSRQQTTFDSFLTVNPSNVDACRCHPRAAAARCRRAHRRQYGTCSRGAHN